MGDLRSSSLRQGNVEEDGEEQARRRRDPFESRHMEKIKTADARDASSAFPSLSPDAYIHLKERSFVIPARIIRALLIWTINP